MASTYAVWELTLACNLGCVHCGSRAGAARQHELTTAEALELVRQMAGVGIAEVTLIGGEAYLRRDWLDIVRAIRGAGMACSMTTGGYGISASAAGAMREAGLQQVSVSIDGLERTHDLLRGRAGSWREAYASMRRLRDAGIAVTCNTQINRLSAPELVLLYEDIVAAGARAWQMALTVPMGRAAEQPELLLQPVELLELYPLLAELAMRAERDGVFFLPGNNIGYYGPYERLLRRGAGRGRCGRDMGWLPGGHQLHRYRGGWHDQGLPIAADGELCGREHPRDAAGGNFGDARTDDQRWHGHAGRCGASVGLLRWL